ncbi:hypothetical protein [Rhizobium sp.]
MILLARLLVIVLLAFLSFMSIRAVADDVYFSDYVLYGKNADTRATIDFSDEKNAAMLDACRTDIFGPGLRLQILRLDQSSATEDYESWYKAIAAAESYLKRAVRCAPYRGDSWARFALVSQQIAEEPKRLSEIMQYALILNPADRNQLMARMTLWSRASSELQSLSKPAIAHDIDIILRYGDELAIRRLLSEKSELLQELSASSLQGLPAARRKAVENLKVE